ncbi:MAG: FHA domain-containing protein, partial [Myxococcales bacterium]|nr:FHA domain-containing protein [Myxococcales bacterium]
MPTLLYCDVDGVDRSFELGDQPALIGRAAECTIRSDDPRMSRQHARFFVEGGACWVEDLGSANGVWVGNQRVHQAAVPPGEIVVVGSLLVQVVDPAVPAQPAGGVHMQLAQWLAMERKARAEVIEERDAFARRVGELHATMAAGGDAGDGAGAAQLAQERDEALSRAAALEHALGAVQDELAAMQARVGELQAEHDRMLEDADKTSTDMTGLQQAMLKLDELSAERERLLRDSTAVLAARDQAEAALAAAQKQAADAEARAASLDKQLGDANEALLVVETTAGVFAAEKLAAADRRVGELEERIGELTGKLAEAGAGASATASAEQ